MVQEFLLLDDKVNNYEQLNLVHAVQVLILIFIRKVKVAMNFYYPGILGMDLIVKIL